MKLLLRLQGLFYRIIRPLFVENIDPNEDYNCIGWGLYICLVADLCNNVLYGVINDLVHYWNDFGL
jgi:hypothetical protein